MRVLDLFCGKGGWSIPFIEDGHDVTGVDIIDCEYPGKLILHDVRTLDAAPFKGYDFIIGSPPCEEFSICKLNYKWHPKGPDIQKGLELVYAFKRVVNEAQPEFWAMENVSMLERYYSEPPLWRFKISKGGRRTLWGNIPIGLAPEFVFKRSLYKDYSSKDKAKRAMIPYSISRLIADYVEGA